MRFYYFGYILYIIVEISNGQNILRGNPRNQSNNQQRSRIINGLNRNNNLVNRNDRGQDIPGGQRPTLINQLRISQRINGGSRQNSGRIAQISGQIAQNSGRILQSIGRISQNNGRITQRNGRISQHNGALRQNIRQFRQNGDRVDQTNLHQDVGRVRQNNILRSSGGQQLRQRNSRIQDHSNQQTQYNDRLLQRGNQNQNNIVQSQKSPKQNSGLLLPNNELKTSQVSEQFRNNSTTQGYVRRNLRPLLSVNTLQNSSTKLGGIKSDSRLRNNNPRPRTAINALRVLPAINKITTNNNHRNNLRLIRNNAGLKGDSEGFLEDAYPTRQIIGGRNKNENYQQQRLRSQRPQMINRILGEHTNQQLHSEQKTPNRNLSVLPYANQINRKHIQNTRRSNSVNQINSDQYQNERQMNHHTSRGIYSLTPDSGIDYQNQVLDQLPSRQSSPPDTNSLQEPSLSQPNHMIELTPNDRFFPGKPSPLGRTVKQSTGNGQSLLVKDVGNIPHSQSLGDIKNVVHTAKDKRLGGEVIKSQREINPRKLRNRPRLRSLPASQATNRQNQRRLQYRLRTRLNSRHPPSRSSPRRRIRQRGSVSNMFGMIDVLTTPMPTTWQETTLNPELHKINLGHNNSVSDVKYITDTLITVAPDPYTIFQNNNDIHGRLRISKPSLFEQPNLTERRITMEENVKELTAPKEMIPLNETLKTTTKIPDGAIDSLDNGTTQSNIEMNTTWPFFPDVVILRKTEALNTHPTHPVVNMDVATQATAKNLNNSPITSRKSISKKKYVSKNVKKAIVKHSLKSQRLKDQETNVEKVNAPASFSIPWIWPDFPAYDTDQKPNLFDEIQEKLSSSTVPSTKARTTTLMTTTKKSFYKILDFDPFKDTKLKKKSKPKSNILTDFLWENPMERLNSLTNSFDMYKQLAAVNNDFGLTPNAFATDNTRIPPPPPFKPPVIHKKKSKILRGQEIKYSTFGNIYLTGGSAGMKIKTIDVSSLLKKKSKTDTKIAQPKASPTSPNIKIDAISKFPNIVKIPTKPLAVYTTNLPTTRHPTTIVTTPSPIQISLIKTTKKPVLTTQSTTRIATMKPTTSKPTTKMITSAPAQTNPIISTLLPTTQIVNRTKHEENVKAELAKIDEIIKDSLLTGYIRTGLQGIKSSKGKNIEIDSLPMRTTEESIPSNPTTRQPTTPIKEKTTTQSSSGITGKPSYKLNDVKLSENSNTSLVRSSLDLMTEHATQRPSDITHSRNQKGNTNSNKNNQVVKKQKSTFVGSQPLEANKTRTRMISKLQNTTTIVKATLASQNTIHSTTNTIPSFNKSEIIQEVQEELLKNSSYVDALVENYIFRHLISPQEDPFSALLESNGQLPTVNLKSFGITSENVQTLSQGLKITEIPRTTEAYSTLSTVQNINTLNSIYDNSKDQNRTQRKEMTPSYRIYTTEPTQSSSSQSLATTLTPERTTISYMDKEIFRLLSHDINSFMKSPQIPKDIWHQGEKNQTTTTTTIKPTTTHVKPTTTTFKTTAVKPITTTVRSKATNVKPSITPVKHTTSTVKPATIIKRTITTVKATTKTFKHTTPTVKATTKTVKPATTSVQPITTTAKPTTTTVKPATTSVQPITTTVKPTTTTVKPATTIVQPITTTVKQTTRSVKPTSTTVKPTTSTVKPTKTPVKPTVTTVQPTTTTVKPTSTTVITTTTPLKPSTNILKATTRSRIAITSLTMTQRPSTKTTSVGNVKPTTNTFENENVKEEKLFNRLKSLIQNLFSSISTEPGVTAKPNSEKQTVISTTTSMATALDTSTPSFVSTTKPYQKEHTTQIKQPITLTLKTTLTPTTETTEVPKSSSTIRTTTSPTTQKTFQTTTTRPKVNSDEALYKKLYDDLFSKMFAKSHNPLMHHQMVPFIPGSGSLSPWLIQGRNNVPPQLLPPQFHLNGQQVPYPANFNSWQDIHHSSLLGRGISSNEFWDRSLNQNPFHLSNKLRRGSFDTSSNFEQNLPQNINSMSNNRSANIVNIENLERKGTRLIKSKSITNPSPEVTTFVPIQQSHLFNTPNKQDDFTRTTTRPEKTPSILLISQDSSYSRTVTPSISSLSITKDPIHSKTHKTHRQNLESTTVSSTNKDGHIKTDKTHRQNLESTTVSSTNKDGHIKTDQSNHHNIRDHIIKRVNTDHVSGHNQTDQIAVFREHPVKLSNKSKQSKTTIGPTTVSSRHHATSTVKLTNTPEKPLPTVVDLFNSTGDVSTENPNKTNEVEFAFKGETTEQPIIFSSTQSIAVGPEFKSTTEDPSYHTSEPLQQNENTMDGFLSDHTTTNILKINQKVKSTAMPAVEQSSINVLGNHQNTVMSKNHQHHLSDLSHQVNSSITSTPNHDKALSNEVSDLALINQMIRSLIGSNETLDGLLQSEPNVTHTDDLLSPHTVPENRFVNQSIHRQNVDGPIKQLATMPKTENHRFHKPASNPFIFHNRQNTRHNLQFLSTTIPPTQRANPFLRHVPNIDPKFTFVPHNSVKIDLQHPAQRKNPFLNRAPTINPLFSFNNRPETNQNIPPNQNFVTKDAIMKKFMEKKVSNSHDSQLVPDATGSLANHIPSDSNSILQRVLMKTLVELDKGRVDPIRNFHRGQNFAGSPKVQLSTRTTTTTTTGPSIEEGGATTEEPGESTTLNLQDIEIGDIQPTFPPNSTVPPGGEWEEYYYYY